jgi:hypothetical protein
MRFASLILLLIAACSGSTEKKSATCVKEVQSLQPDNVLINADGRTIETRFAPPQSYIRIPFPEGSFPEYLREIPLKPHGSDVKLYDGRTKPGMVHEAVIDRDPGRKNIQQCADAVIRLRAEYLYSREEFNALHFNLTNGFRVDYSKWMQGYRVAVDGNRTWWVKSGEPGNSEAIFRQYLEFIYSYAGTISLAGELKKAEAGGFQPGDVFIHGGSPGHAVIIVDAAVNAVSGEKIFMLAQSYMPAQEIHILKNPDEPAISPWYRLNASSYLLNTPEWTFKLSDLMRFENIPEE